MRGLAGDTVGAWRRRQRLCVLIFIGALIRSRCAGHDDFMTELQLPVS